MEDWLPAVHGRGGTKANAIADAIGADLAAGRLRAGDRLPPQRGLARSLGVSLNTVMRGYAEATRRGYIAGQVGRGSYVLQAEPSAAAPVRDPLRRPADGPIDLSTSLPFLGEADRALAATLTELSRQSDLAGLLDQSDRSARDRQLRAGATWLSGLGLPADPNHMLITNGAQHGIFVALLALLRPGDTLLTGPLAYAPIKTIAHHLRVRIRAVAADEEGLLPDSLAAACREAPARVLYCTPTLHTPTTATMTEHRRRRIAQVAAAHDLVIVEDDVFGFLPPARPQPLAAIAPDRTILITSASKSLAPGLRIGYALAPTSIFADVAATASLTCWMIPPLMAEIARRWIEDGTARALNQAQRSHATRRQILARRLLAGHPHHADEHGFHIWLPLPAHWTARAFVAAAEQAGVLVNSAATFSTSGEAPAAVRLCLSHETTDERVVRGLTIVADLLDALDSRGDHVV